MIAERTRLEAELAELGLTPMSAPGTRAGRLGPVATYREGAPVLDEGHFIEREEDVEPEEEVDWAVLESEQARGIPAGSEPLSKVTLLRGHRGTGPDLVLFWNDMAGQPQSVDVVVHLHGFSLVPNKLMDLVRNVVPRSGLDWSDPKRSDPTPGRTRPTLALLPRGNFYGGETKRGYSFPALVTETGLQQLIEFGLDHFARRIGATRVALRRLILTAHSGGGAALLRLLRHNDPHEVHVFDGLYGKRNPTELIRWAEARIARDLAALAAGEPVLSYMRERGGALRVLFRSGTKRGSLAVARALAAAITSGSELARWYRVEQTSEPHATVPRPYGWRLLADASADLPMTIRPGVSARELHVMEEEACEYGEEAFAEFEAPSVRDVIFPSGESLQVVTGYPEGTHQEFWDPTGSGNPLLDTGRPHKEKKLSADFRVRELTTSGGVSADVARIDPKLVQNLQALRDHVGRGISITSGYRSWKRNDDIYRRRGKEPTKSQHCAGRGADISIAGMNGLAIGKAAIAACGPNIGVGLGPNFAHIDVRGYAEAWPYAKVSPSWVKEIKDYQKAKGGSRRPIRATPTRATPKPSNELVRFAQRVLNAVEGERLDADGILGLGTRGALERFRKKHNLGAGGVLDDKTSLALAQRALEEIAQQSMFAQPGVLDAKSEQALKAFKSERRLGFSATLDAATRTALADSLARRAAVPSTPAPVLIPSGIPKLGAGLTPPVDPSAYRKFRLTTYHVVDQHEAPTGAVRVPIYDASGRKIAEGSPTFFAQLSLEGTARLTHGRLINVTGKTIPVSHDEYAEVLAYHRQAYARRDQKRREEGRKPTPTTYSGIVIENGRVVRALAFHEVPASRRGIGYGLLRGIPLVPFRTLAADIGAKANHDKDWKGKGGLVPAGTQVYIREYDGLGLPGGTTHDGWFIVNDTGGGIFGAHFDVFVGSQGLRKQVKLPAFGQVWFAGIERRIPAGYSYGLRA